VERLKRHAIGNVKGTEAAVGEPRRSTAARGVRGAAHSEDRSVERQILDMNTRQQQRIGEELHDGLGQELAGIASLSAALRRRMAGRDNLANEERTAAMITELANQALRHARVLVRGLCPVRVEEDGLMVSLMELVEHMGYVHGCRCEFECQRPALLADHSAATQLYHIAAEAVEDAVCRGQARHVRIRLAVEEGCARLSVEHDGSTADGGRGISGILRSRARMIGASLGAEPLDGPGERLTCTLETNHSKLSHTKDGL
jgi:signal transduction histidine kinase